LLAKRGHAPGEALDASFKELPLELEVGRLAALPGKPFKTGLVEMPEPGTAVVSLDDYVRCAGEHWSVHLDEPPLLSTFADNPRRARHCDDVRRQPVQATLRRVIPHPGHELLHPGRLGRVNAGNHPGIRADNQHRSAVVDALSVQSQERHDNSPKSRP
jgi:hypothetical protein